MMTRSFAGKIGSVVLSAGLLFGTAVGSAACQQALTRPAHHLVHDMSRNHGFYKVSAHCQWEFGHDRGQRDRWSVVCG